MKKRLILFCVLAVILIELFIRVSWQIPEKTYPLGMHTFDPYSGYRLTPGFIGNFPEYLGGYDISINSQGLRDYEHNYNKSKTRILVLGDTISFGTGLDYNSTFPHLLENKFNSGGYGIEVINTGVNGYQPSQEYAYYQNEGYKYDPDVILIGIALNDILPADPVSKFKDNFEKYNDSDSNPPDPAIKSLVKKTCHSCVFIYSIAHNYNNDYFGVVYKTWENESELAEYSDKLNLLNSELKSKNVTLFLVIFPYSDQFGNSRYGLLPQEKIKSLAKSQNISYIDLTSFLDVADYKKYYLSYDRLHMNPEGNKFVTEIVYSDLILKGMLK